jgi:hypothetical protein
MDDRIGTLTSLGGVDLPSRRCHTCLGLWFLNPSACQVHLHCIFHIVISCSCFAYLLWNHFFYPYSFSCYLEKILQVFHRDDRKTRRAAAFLSWYRSSLPEVRFAITLHAWTRFFFSCVECFFFFFFFLLLFIFFKKKGFDARVLLKVFSCLMYIYLF